jgi:hypothetical protein
MSYINSKLREAQQQLRAVLKEATELREAHLRELLQITQDANEDREHEKRLKILIRAHKKQYAYRKIQQVLKPKQRSGLTHILVPESSSPTTYPQDLENVTAWTMVHEHSELQQYLLQRNKKHFSQAHGTPFTIPPLNQLSWGADDPLSERILSGDIPHELNCLNPYVQAVLHYIGNRKQLPDIDTYITSDEVAKGFRKWRETTSTSPSGCHLGLRKLPAIPTNDKEIEKMRTQILAVQTHIINIPLHNGFSPLRWQMVINAMLEKIPGRPLLHKLRVIHILEADYNLILKVIFGKRLMKNCELNGTLGDLQDGFRKGRSTTRTLLHNELLNDYHKRMRINNYIGMTDISGCFDRILPSITSLLNRKNGCPKSAVKMHSETLKHAKYHVKTKQGISEDFYSNTSTPVYGNGQGAGDSPSQWSQESAMLFDIYDSTVPGAQMSLRTGDIVAKIPLAAFADDTNLMGNNDNGKKTRSELIHEVKTAFGTWDKLLHATGHFMELGKCACYLSLWEFQEDGYAYTLSPEEHKQEIFVTDIHGQEQKIIQLQTNQSQKLLGVMKNPIGDQQDEITRLRKKSDNYARRINSNALTRSEARLAYEAFYLPAMRYSLNITSINQTDMEKIQAKATAAFLSAQGFNRHMPREVVFAPTRYQGIGLRHLYDLQGTDGTRLLLQEVNSEGSTTQRMIIALLDAIQMEAGIGDPILENCRPLDYIEWGWIQLIRDYLQHINGHISIGNRQKQLFRENDCYLMDAPYLEQITQRERIYINRCRLHLQVSTLSDISTAAGNRIHKAWFNPADKKPSRSTLQWPRQNSPNRPAWMAWEKLLRSFQNEQGRLRKPLGAWTKMNDRIYDAYVSEDQEFLWLRQANKSFNGHPQCAIHRKHTSFHIIKTTTIKKLPPHAIPVDILYKTDNTLKISKTPGYRHTKKSAPQPKAWYKNAPERWEHMLGKITMLISDEEIEQLINKRTVFEAASDGGFDPTSGISSFGWVATINKIIVARGRGPVQAHPLLAESFRAEGYGAASLGLFLRNLVTKFNINAEQHRWKLYIDNKSLIQRLHSFDKHKCIPRWNLRPDEDIAKATHKILNHIPIQLIHTKGHQDSSMANEQLSFDAHLNIFADKEATMQRQTMQKPESTVQKLGVAQLRINEIDITRDSQRWLLHTAGKIPIEQYYRERHGWSKETFNTIGWDTQLAVLRQYNSDDQTRIIKFVQGWLPTQHRKFKEGAAPSPACKLCPARIEDNIHLFKCTNTDISKLHGKIQEWLWRSVQEHGNSEIANIFEVGLTESVETPSWKPDMRYISPEWVTGIKEQNNIGWRHVYYGRISTGIIKGMEKHFRKSDANRFQFTGERWARQFIRTIWDNMLEIWKERNGILNQEDKNSTTSNQKQKLVSRIQRCYNFQSNLKASERQQWFGETLENIMQKDIRFLEAWTRAVEKIVTITKREQRRRPKESQIMERFLGIEDTQQLRTRAENEHPRRFSQELNPD